MDRYGLDKGFAFRANDFDKSPLNESRQASEAVRVTKGRMRQERPYIAFVHIVCKHTRINFLWIQLQDR
jgi:hypothetical protein